MSLSSTKEHSPSPCIKHSCHSCSHHALLFQACPAAAAQTPAAVPNTETPAPQGTRYLCHFLHPQPLACVLHSSYFFASIAPSSEFIMDASNWMNLCHEPTLPVEEARRESI